MKSFFSVLVTVIAMTSTAYSQVKTLDCKNRTGPGIPSQLNAAVQLTFVGNANGVDTYRGKVYWHNKLIRDSMMRFYRVGELASQEVYIADGDWKIRFYMKQPESGVVTGDREGYEGFKADTGAWGQLPVVCSRK